MNENEIGKVVVDASLKAHKVLGPGLLESAYEASLAHELRNRGMHIETQKALPVFYEDISLDIGYRVDIMVNEKVIIELKAVETIHPVHVAQLLTYLKLSGCKLGFLINFNVTLIKDGIKRMVNNL